MKESECGETSSSSSSLMGRKKRKRIVEGGGEGCPCTECGKKFWSPKALYGHMRCHPEREWRGINPPPNFKRQKQIMMTVEDHEVAACLLLLANGNPNAKEEQFECSSCNKVFGSHQALGGHRASHKNVKGCFAATESVDDINNNNNNNMMMMMMGSSSSSSDGHKCSICLRVFSTGQALGGHKRCHWDKAGDNLNLSPKPVDLNLPPPLDLHHSPPLSLDLRLGL